MPKQPRSHQIASDSPQYIKAWARDLLDAVGKREARRILGDYRKLADDPKVTKKGRQIAAERANALEKLL